MTIKPEDDLLHRGNLNPYWNESAWFGFSIPEEKIGGWAYFYHRPNMNLSVGGVALWDDRGDASWDCLYYDFGQLCPLEPEYEMYDFALPNGLTVKCVEPLRSYSLRYRADGCELDLRFDGAHPPNDTGLPAGVDEWGKGHYEQLGRMTGTVRAEGRELAVNCWSNRDHSWGPRTYDRNPRGDFPWAIASKDSAFQVLTVSDLAREDDPVIDVVDPIIAGWYLRDGVMGQVVSGTREVTERGREGRPLSVRLVAQDDLGRELVADGECVNWLKFHGWPFAFWWWSLTDWSFDGNRGWGNVMDYFPPQQSRELFRSYLKQERR